MRGNDNKLPVGDDPDRAPRPWRRSGSVPFRAVVGDTAGNRLEQTVIRAYLLR